MLGFKNLFAPVFLIRQPTNSFFSFNRFCTSLHYRKYSKSALKAILATKIIKLIQNSQAPKNLEEFSLRQKILDLKSQMKILDQLTQMKIVDQKEKKKEDLQRSIEEVFDLFEGGVSLDKFFFVQSRVRQASQPLQDQNSKLQKPKFIFCPNFLVTKKIFSYLGRKQDNDFVITGGSETGTSISIILYIQLSNFITKFFSEAVNNPIKQKQLIQLQQLRMLNQKVYKYFYWSIDQNHIKKDNFFMNLILNQAFQLSIAQKQQLKKCRNPFDLLKMLNKFYPTNIFQRRNIVDQIEILASMIRELNEEEQLRKKYQGVDHIPVKIMALINENNDRSFKFRLIERLKTMLYIFLLQGASFGVNSSTTLERELLNPSNAEGKITLQLEERQAMDCYRVPYEKQIRTTQGMNDFLQSTWFDIERRLLSYKNNPKTIMSIKKQFFQNASVLSPSCFYKFLNVRQLFDTSDCFKKINNPLEQSIFVSQINQLSKEFEDKGFQIQKAMFKKIFNQSNPQEKALISAIHQLAQRQWLSEDKRHSLLQFNNKVGIGHQLLKGKNVVEILQQKILRQSEIQEKMPFEVLSDQNIRLPWTPKQFLKMSTEILYPKVFKEHCMILQQNDRQKLHQCNGAKGLEYQLQLRKCLTRGVTVQFQIFQKNEQDNRIVSNFEKIKIYSEAIFLHFNPPQHDPNLNILANSFKDILTFAKMDPGKFYISFPHYMSKKQKSYIYSSRNRSIDFIINKYDSTSRVHHITSYNATVSKDIDSKVAKIIQMFRVDICANLKRFNKTPQEFSFRHIIVCPKEVCQAQQTLQFDGFTIQLQFANAFNLPIQGCKDQQASAKLQQVISLCQIDKTIVEK